MRVMSPGRGRRGPEPAQQTAEGPDAVCAGPFCRRKEAVYEASSQLIWQLSHPLASHHSAYPISGALFRW